LPSDREDKGAKAVRVVARVVLLIAGAITLSSVIGFAVTQVSESRLAGARYAALAQALGELGAETDEIVAVDDARLRLIERRTGVRDLRFETEPTPAAGRSLQSVHDEDGRIVGWFSWDADDVLVGAMDRTWGVFGAVGIGLAVGALLTLRVSRRRVGSRQSTSQTGRRASGPGLLSRLPIRRAVLDRLNDALAARRSGVVALALIDLDGFGEVNDTLGRGGGDAVMANVAEHLQAALPADALLGRFEEDEFAVVVSGENPRTATFLADALRAALQRPIFVDRMWQITAGIGIAQAPQDGQSGDELARRARLALRAAKREGRSRVRHFEPQVETDHAERRFLLRELQTAVSLQTFDVHYQPIVAADGGAVVGVEALLRWTHPSRGAVAPAEFIALAERSGLMSQLGEIVLRRALSDAARWPSLSVSVNLSPVQIRERWLVDLVGVVMAETGIPSSRVVLEVTESVLIDNPQEALKRLEALRALGVSLALDDFGSGYSSLSYLQKFPFDRLKIDRSFVAALGATASAGAIIQSVVTLGHGLGMKVLAEGVETDEQRVLLRLAGCDEMQGFLFARPGPAAEIDAMLARPRRAAAG
jgi:diguanylate cyclase (GGDEF)-like protein